MRRTPIIDAIATTFTIGILIASLPLSHHLCRAVTQLPLSSTAGIDHDLDLSSLPVRKANTGEGSIEPINSSNHHPRISVLPPSSLPASFNRIFLAPIISNNDDGGSTGSVFSQPPSLGVGKARNSASGQFRLNGAGEKWQRERKVDEAKTTKTRRTTTIGHFPAEAVRPFLPSATTTIPSFRAGTNVSSPQSLFHAHPVLAALICLVVTVLILATLIGNCMVCLAIILVRKLKQQPANLLLVSLAVADFSVGLLVMPIALVNIIEDRWLLGDFICRLWTSADLTLCTASILNLCAISVDRYLAVTRALRYSAMRTRKRILCYIVVVWIGALLVSATPLILLPLSKIEHSCQVSQNQLYQIYATIISFYGPCLIMVVVYVKMWRAAKAMQKQDKLAMKWTITRSPLSNNPRGDGGSGDRKKKSRKEGKRSRDYALSESTRVLSTGQIPPPAGRRQASSNSNSSNNTSFPNTSLFVMLNNHMGSGNASDSKRSGIPHRMSASNAAASTTAVVAAAIQSPITPISPLKRFQRSSGLLMNNLNSVVKMPLIHHGSRSPQYGEDKARKTLGVIMSVFIICWVPFFILALVKSQYEINVPKWLDTLVIWLGYSNSCLNPGIYARYNKEFRVPFREMLCCRFNTLQVTMRNESFYSKYGPSLSIATSVRNSAVLRREAMKQKSSSNGAISLAPALSDFAAAIGTTAVPTGVATTNNNIVSMVNEHHYRSRHYPQRYRNKRNSTPCTMEYLMSRPSRIIGDEPIEE